MEIPFPGDEIVKALPPGAPAEEQARFIFKIPDYRTTRTLIRTIERVATEEIETEDGWRVFVGLTLDRIEGLTHDGAAVPLEREENGALTEECAARLGRFMAWLFRVAQGFIQLSETELKNS